MNPAPLPSPFFRRLMAAVCLQSGAYHEIAADDYATRQAVAVVCLSALAQRSALFDQIGAWAILVIMVFSIVRWLLFTGIAYLIGRIATREPLSYQRLLRCLGFAEAPAVLNFVVYSVDPPMSMILGFAVWFWLLAATIVGIRAALGIGRWRAGVIGVASFLCYLLPGFLVPPR